VCSFLGRTGMVRAEGHGTARDGNVGEGLGEVAELLAGNGVVLLGQETDVVAQAQEPLVKGGGLVATIDQGEAVDEPERTQ